MKNYAMDRPPIGLPVDCVKIGLPAIGRYGYIIAETSRIHTSLGLCYQEPLSRARDDQNQAKRSLGCEEGQRARRSRSGHDASTEGKGLRATGPLQGWFLLSAVRTASPIARAGVWLC